MITAAVEDRFWAKVDTSGVCWEWTAAVIKTKGYGVFQRGRGLGTALAHRMAFEILVGPIPDGKTLDHECRNHRCVNPDHLTPRTIGDNMLRGGSPAAINARKTRCVRNHSLADALVRPGRIGHTQRVCRQCESNRTR